MLDRVSLLVDDAQPVGSGGQIVEPKPLPKQGDPEPATGLQGSAPAALAAHLHSPPTCPHDPVPVDGRRRHTIRSVPVTLEELLAAACPTIGTLGAAFYFTPETLARGKELGLDGFRFYFLGRGGVLGDVEAKVVTSAFGYFNASLVQRIWDSAKATMAPRDAGRAYLDCCRQFGQSRFADVADLDAFCDAAETVNDAVGPAGLALYAGLSAEPLPEDLPGRAMQLVASLREFRGSAHLLAVLASGLMPVNAHHIHRPDMMEMFGWDEATLPGITEDDRHGLAAADALTDRLVGPAYAVLDDGQRHALVDGLNRLATAAGQPASA